MNSYIATQCKNMIASVGVFKQACQMAAMKDDGAVSKEEQKLLNKINKLSDKYIKELEKLN